MNNLVAHCISCGWKGAFEDGTRHENDAHLVVYREEEPKERPKKPCGCFS